MTFFNWTPGAGDSEPLVSGYIWIYFLITGASTLLTLGLFWYFIPYRQRNGRGRVRADECPA